MAVVRSSSLQAKRIAAWRKKANRNGLRRLEIAVPAADGALMRKAAAALRKGGQPARKLRTALQQNVQIEKTEDGTALLAFFRSSPLVGVELDSDRDRSTGSPVDLA